MNKKYVYYDRSEYCFKNIDAKYLKNPETLKEYFSYIDEHLENNKLVIYELVPHITLVKDIAYKFK